MADDPRLADARAKGWKMPPNTVKVDRTTKWNNPFHVGETICVRGPVDQAGAVQMFRDMLADHELMAMYDYPADPTPLRGKNLACWCKSGTPCHADVLMELANA
jgi:hypothetical protein